MTDPASQWLPLLAVVTLGVIGAAGAFVLTAGLFEARSLIYREFTAYFLSPMAYAVFAVFLGITGYLFGQAFDLLNERGPRGVEFPMLAIFGDERFWLIYLFLPPLLTMRLFAEERSTGTLETLLTAPLKDWQIVLAKYLGCLGFYLVLWLPTLLYLPVLLGLDHVQLRPTWNLHTILAVLGLGMIVAAVAGALLPTTGTRGHAMALALVVLGSGLLGFGAWNHYRRDSTHFISVTAELDPAPVACSYVGLALAGAMFLAIGVLASSLVRSQLLAAVLSIAIGLVFLMTGFWKPDFAADSVSAQVVCYLSVPMHFARDFGRGLIDSRHLVLYVSVAAASLFLATRSLERRRWE